MMISVHLPKTAGTSFAAALEKHFGTALLRDYADLPMNTPAYERNNAALQASLLNGEHDFAGVECIHGHFLPLKYLLLSVKRKVNFITWMRNPVQRVLSHYFFWKRSYDPSTAPELHRRVVEEEWTLERFCLGSEVRDLYSQLLWGFPIERFDFIGIVEHYDDDLANFAKRFLGTDLEVQRENCGDREGNEYEIDRWLASKIEAFHERDVYLYTCAIARRLQRNA